MEVKHGWGEEQGARLKSRKPFAVFRGRVEGLWGLWHLEREVQSEIIQEGRDGAEKLDFLVGCLKATRCFQERR